MEWSLGIYHPELIIEHLTLPIDHLTLNENQNLPFPPSMVDVQ
jgi:hypothetical protein